MSTTDGIAAIGIRHLYGDHLAVDGVSLGVARGEIFGLLGPNGAGKTTLLRVLAGILRPTEGRVEILGRDPARGDYDPRRHLGFLSGDTALYGRLTVREQLVYFGRLHRLPKERIEERIRALTAELELSPFLDRRAAALSSGQRQRANLARAFLTDPEVLILDEPTVGLDVISGRFVAAAIGRAREAGKALVFSTHVMSEVEALCDRVGVLVGGRLRAVGPHDALLAEHGARTMAELIIRFHGEGAAS